MHGFERSDAWLELLRLQARAAAMLVHLEAQSKALCAQARAGLDQVDWYNLRPVLLVGGGVLALFALLLYVPPESDDAARKYWTDLALAGRWMVCGLGLGVILLWKAGVV